MKTKNDYINAVYDELQCGVCYQWHVCCNDFTAFRPRISCCMVMLAATMIERGLY